MSNYKLVYTKQARKDAKKIVSSGLKSNVEELLDVLRENPWKQYPPFEKIAGDLNGAFSRRINIQHRLVYQVYENKQIVKIIRMWTHYD